MELVLRPYQERFFNNRKRYPSLISGIATGKTMLMLLKIWNYCMDYPESQCLVVRKEYTDLRDSTMKDFERYFGAQINSDKEYRFSNGSVIMFRHGAEVNVLKNVNLNVFGIEQAEEFDTSESFDFLRDRLRRDNAPYRQGLVIANANGHNWIWKKWINNPSNDEFEAILATTFDNEQNLPKDFIDDLKQMQIDAPNHYNRYVMNSFEEDDVNDLLIESRLVRESPFIEFIDSGSTRRILAVDVARYGLDETVFTMIESHGLYCWEQTLQEIWKHKSLMETTGKVIDISRNIRPDIIVIDDVGLGGGVVDRLKELRMTVQPFNGANSAINDKFNNRRSEAYFNLGELIRKRYLKILNDEQLIEQISSIRFKYKSNGQQCILSKDEMRKEGFKSPDRADALCMAVDLIKRALSTRDVMSLPREALV